MQQLRFHLTMSSAIIGLSLRRWRLKAAPLRRMAVVRQPPLARGGWTWPHGASSRFGSGSSSISTRAFSSQHRDAAGIRHGPPIVKGAVTAGVADSSPSSPVHLLQEAESLWSEVTKQAQRIDASTTLLMLRLLQRCGEVALQRQIEVIAEALQLEQKDAEADQLAAAATNAAATLSGDERSSTTGSRGAPVYVDASCYAVLLDSLTAHFGRPSGVAEAQAAYASIIQHHTDTVAHGHHARAHKLQMNQSARNAYLRFLHRAGLTDDVMRVWAAQSPADKESNPDGLAVVLRALSLTDNGHLRVVRLMDTDGARLQWSAEVCRAWLSCFSRHGDWRGAEDAWRRMQQRGVAFNSDLYCKLMQIFIGSDEPEQLAKIEPLYAQMQSRSGSSAGSQPPPPLHFTLSHLEELIKAAHHASAPTTAGSAASKLAARSALDIEMVKWCGRAVAAGMSEQLDTSVFQMTHQAIQRMCGNAPTADRSVSSLRAESRPVSAKVAFMADLMAVPVEQLAVALQARGLPMPSCVSRESIIDGLVGGASSAEMRQAVRLSCNPADVD